MSDERASHKVDHAKVKVGDVMAMVTFYKVKRAGPQMGQFSVTVTDLTTPGGSDFDIRGADLVERCLSADQAAAEVRVTRTELAELLIASHNRPLTVVFDKADGAERVLRGRLVKHEAVLGRSMVEDLDIADHKDRVRLVDHRTLKKLVVDGVSYVLKK